MSRLSDYVDNAVAGVPEAPSDGFNYARNGNSQSWIATYSSYEQDALFAPLGSIPTDYVDLSSPQTIGGLKQFSDPVGVQKVASGAYALDVGGNVNLSAGFNYFINGIPISSFVDAPSDNNIYGRQNALWVEITQEGGGTVTNLSNTASTTTVTINNSGGTGTTLASATTSLAGVMTAADKTNLNAALKSGDVDLGYSRSSTSNTITNTAGDNATLLAATTSLAGVLTAADKTGLDKIQAPASWSTSSTSSVANVTYDGSTMFSIGLPGLINPSIYAGLIDPINYAKLDNMFNNSTLYQTSSKVYLRGASVGMYVYETAASSGSRNWTINASGNTLYVGALSDAGSLGSSFFGFTRSSNNIVSMKAFGSAIFDGPVSPALMFSEMTPTERTNFVNFLETQGVLGPGRAAEINNNIAAIEATLI